MPEAPRRGLGRGLAALLGDPVAGEPGLAEVSVAAIRPNPAQPRRSFDDDGLDALAASVATSGVVQPVVVRPLGDGAYELVAGERRWRAALRAGLERVPAVIRQVGERDRLELALVENLVREDLNAIEVASALAVLVEDFGQSHEELAVRLGRSRPAVSNLLRLLELPDDVQALVVAGELTEGHARAVLMADGARARRTVARRAVDERLSVRQTEAAARARARRPPVRPEDPVPLADEAVDAFFAAFGAPVRVGSSTKGGVVVELRFESQEELRAALERLGRLDPAG